MYTYEGYDNLYDVGNSYMSEDCKKVAEVLELIGLKARDNYYALQIVGVFKGYTGFDPRIRTEREEAACLIAGEETIQLMIAGALNALCD